MVNKYNTPTLDKILKEDGWKRLKHGPIYIKKTDEPGYPYKIFFSVGYKEYFYFYEKFYKKLKDLGTYDDLHAHIRHSLYSGGTVTYIKDDKTPFILALVADFYSHAKDIMLHEKYKKLYEEQSGRIY